MEPLTVVPVDPSSSRALDVGDGLVLAVVEDRRAHAFGFVEPVGRLHQGVTVCVADGSERRGDALQREMLGQYHRGVSTG